MIIGDFLNYEGLKRFNTKILSKVQDMLSNYVPTSRTVNKKALTGNISLTASDVGALPLSGGTITGPIKYNSGSMTSTPITVYDGGDTTGQGLVIGAGGITMIGGGEAAASLYNTLVTNGTLTATTEQLHLGSDGAISLHTNCNTIGSRKTVTIDTAGKLIAPGGFVGAKYNIESKIDELISSSSSVKIQTGKYAGTYNMGDTGYNNPLTINFNFNPEFVLLECEYGGYKYFK